MNGCPKLSKRYSRVYRVTFRRYWSAIVAETGSLTRATGLWLEANRVCALAAEFEAAQADLALARGLRATGKGRRPSEAKVNRLAHRMNVASSAYAEAHERLMGSEAVAKLKAERATAALRARVAAGRGETAAPGALAGAERRDGNRQAEDGGVRSTEGGHERRG
jgi:hypothetical protein